MRKGKMFSKIFGIALVVAMAAGFLISGITDTSGLIADSSIADNDLASIATAKDGSDSSVGATTPSEVHQKAWKEAAAKCCSNNYYKYSIYSSRSVAVSNPEVYLQADILWMDMINRYGGWESNYLARDRELAGTDWWKEVGEKINDGFRYDKHSGAFQWESFNWEEHTKNAVDLFDFYGDAPKLNWLDNRLVFLWNAMKGLSWKMPQTSLAEAEYLILLSEGKEVYLVLTEDRKGYVAELRKDNIILHNPLAGELLEDVGGEAVLAMNNDHVWYPLMGRDDRARDTGLGKVVEKYCEEDKKPELAEFERSILGHLKEGTKLESEIEFSWAKLLAIRAVNQNTWRSKPLRELSAKLLPERYKEDSDYSDSPNEQVCLGMVITEMGNRLSPISATWAQIIQKNASDPRKAFEELAKQYWKHFHRTDSHSEWVYGDYYRCWFPNLDDKLISGLGNCIVEATNAMAALSLAEVEEWEIYESNWWSLEKTGGHVICGAYTRHGNFSLSNGLFNTNDQCCLNGPLWDIDGTAAQEVIYSPEQGFVTFVQTKNAADFADYETPFTNLDFEEAVAFLQHVKLLDEKALIAVEYWPVKVKTIDEYIDYITEKVAQWETNKFRWPWDNDNLGANNPPNAPSNPFPANDAAGVSIPVTLSVLVADPDGDTMTVTFYDAFDDSAIGIDADVASGSRAEVTWWGIPCNTDYSWYAKANDGELDSPQSDTWSFTTFWTWDPWVYDEIGGNGNGYIEIAELLNAIDDYMGGYISISVLLEVINLYISHTHK